jgi:hypothetical protein
MRITVETTVKAPVADVWRAWTPQTTSSSGWQAILNNFARHAEAVD